MGGYKILHIIPLKELLTFLEKHLLLRAIKDMKITVQINSSNIETSISWFDGHVCYHDWPSVQTLTIKVSLHNKLTM